MFSQDYMSRMDRKQTSIPVCILTSPTGETKALEFEKESAAAAYEETLFMCNALQNKNRLKTKVTRNEIMCSSDSTLASSGPIVGSSTSFSTSSTGISVAMERNPKTKVGKRSCMGNQIKNFGKKGDWNLLGENKEGTVFSKRLNGQGNNVAPKSIK